MANANKTYKNVFIDLDRTLWDFERNSWETLHDVFFLERLPQRGLTNFDIFMKKYTEINNQYWSLYREGKIEKESLRWRRFYDTFRFFGIDDKSLSERFSDYYIKISPTKTGVFPYTIELMEYLHTRYNIDILTNGFSEIQSAKIQYCGLSSYIQNLITSEAAGYKKPDVRMFEFALQKAHAEAETTIMIGDEFEVDIIGAANAGIDTIYVNFQGDFNGVETTYQVSSLKKIMDIL
ncbi:MAG: YjjG family noncanonical pyrimidine nucleotidase [Bacteroidales bacterium]|nr:YjjG family noncanonical pyrimidine nucleotidase [Bacteroidales bacterium]